MAESAELTVKTEASLEIYNKLVRDAHRLLAIYGGEKTISSGAITIDPGGDGYGFYDVAAESGTTDDLETISGASGHDIILLRAKSTHTITLVHGSGNIYLPNSTNLTMSGSSYIVFMLWYTGTNWRLIGDSTASSATGYVTGPASAADNAIARFNGTGGKDIQNSVVTVDDTTGAIKINAHQALTDPTASPSGKYLKDDGTWDTPAGAGWDGDIADIDLDGGTDIGAALADGDLMLVDDGAGGTNRKSAISRVWTYIWSKFTGASDKATPLSADIIPIQDTADSNNVKEMTITNMMKALDIDGMTDIGADLADADLVIVDDGAGGTNRKSALSRFWTYISGKVNAANGVALTGLDIDGGTDIGAALVDADLIIVDDGAGGTNRKSAMSRVKTYAQGIKIDDLTAGDDNTDLDASTTKHGLLLKATAPAANELNVVGIGNGETAYANKDLFNTTTPEAIGTAAAGTGVQASRSDHVHAADAANVTYTPTTLADWTGAADPGDVDNALDALADRVAELWDGTMPSGYTWKLQGSLSDDSFSGIRITGTSGETLTFGQLIYLKASDSRWYRTDANAEATAGPVKIGINLTAAGGSGVTIYILIYGVIRDDSTFPAFTISAPVYVGTAIGEMQVAAPTGSGDIVRIIGHANTADELYFNPSANWLTHA